MVTLIGQILTSARELPNFFDSHFAVYRWFGQLQPGCMDAGKGNGKRTDGQVAAKVAAKTRWTGWAPDCNTTQIQCFDVATCRTKTNILEHALSQHQCSNWLGGVRCKE